jgi:hypothetical protein
MGLGPTLVGGAIGAAVGMALHLIVETTTHYEAPWFAVIIGLLTGLGVHQANKSLAGRVSYLRGAVSAAIALAAIVGSTPLISMIAKNKEAALSTAAAPAGRDAAATDGEGADADAEGAAATEAVAARDRARGSGGVEHIGAPMRPPGEFNTLQFVFMALGTFIAYEFGRGTGKGTATPAEAPPEPVTVTDPSN